jgi:hypothetical protein
MAVSIKKSIKYFIILIGIIIMFPTMLYLALQIPSVQTGIIRQITGHLSRELQSTISIGKINYKFFNRLSLTDVLVKDRNNDTLLYSEILTAGIRRLDFKDGNISLGRVLLNKPVFSLITDSTGQLNLTWFLDHLKSSSTDTLKDNKTHLSIDQVDLTDAKFSMVKYPITESKTGINFNDLKVSNINGSVRDLNIKNDTTSFSIYNLSFREKSGFGVHNMSSSATLTGSDFLFGPTLMNSDSSMMNFEKIRIMADSSGSYSNFTEDVRLDVIINHSYFNTSDLHYFIKLPEELKESVWISGNVNGTISELRGRDINLKYGDYTTLDCDFDISGLPQIDNSYIYIGVNNFKTNAKDIGKLTIPGSGRIIIPEVVYRLGNISFNGSFTGFTTDFVTYGEFRTNQGTIRTDISLRPEESNRYKIKGLISGSYINLGLLTGSELLGKLTMKANIDGYASSFKKFEGNLTGTIDSVEINNYNYRNINLNGYFTDKTWDGNINVSDKNIKLDVLGMFNFRESLPEFDFTLNLAKANLHELNIDKVDSTSSLSLLLTSNFRGNNIDNLDGEIKLLNSNLTRNDKTIELYDFSIRSTTENNMPRLSLRTDFVNADIRGRYNFGGLKDLVVSTLASVMPSLFHEPGEMKELKENDFTFDINFRNTEKLSEIFNTGISLADKSHITGSVDPDSVISIHGSAPFLNVENILFNNFSFDAKSSGSLINADIDASSVILLGKSELKDFAVRFNTNPDNFVLTADWNNNDAILNKGNITARGHISRSTSNQGNPVLLVEIDSSKVYSRNNLWEISQSTIKVDSNSVSVDDLHIGNKDRFYMIHGAVSENPSDTLYLQFRDIDISPLNYVGSKGKIDTTKFSLHLGGRLNGNISLTNVYRDLLLQGRIRLNDFTILGGRYGDINVNSDYNKASKLVELSANNNYKGTKALDAKGYYDPAAKKINVNTRAEKLPVEALNPLLRSFASGITGFASGKVNLSGTAGDLVLKGSLFADNVTMKIDYLQTTYKMNDSVRFDKTGIKFNNLKFTDDGGRQATLNGAVYHTNFKDFQTDLTINMGNDFHVLNTQPKDNELFYGKVYASGVTKIKTGPQLLSFDISARTGRNTKLSIPLNTGLSVSEYNFISFVNPSGSQKEDSAVVHKPAVPDELGLKLNIDLSVTSDAVAELIFDPKVGDKMTGSGTGELNISYEGNEFKISGDYIIEKGDYLFTLGNFFNKRFEVENGGRLMFNGDLDNAEIELKAIYQKFNTSLFPILRDDKFNERVAVEPQLLLSGNLFNPTVKFDINLPNADEEIRTYLRNALSTEEELSRQFLSLLLMKSFYSDQASAASNTATTTGTSTMAVTTTEMLSNQLSNWISQISNDFNLGFVYKPGTGNKAMNPDEVQVALSTQILDDRVILNGNFDYRGTTTTEQLTGDFDAELKITEKVRFKVFNRFNENTTYTGRGPYTQGIGIMFKEDFDRISDLFKKRTRSTMKKEDEVTMKPVQ